MMLTRRALVAGGLAAPAILSLGSRAQAATTLKLSHQFPGGTIDEGDFRDRMCRKFAAAIKEREDTAKLNANLQQELAGKGLTFNQPAIAPFRDKLRSAGFYAEWKGKYGDEAWAILEKAIGRTLA